MSIDIFQSQRLDVLFTFLKEELSQKQQRAIQVLQEKWIIIPNQGMAQWLQLRLAKQQGVSANLKFSAMRTTQWELYKLILGYDILAKTPQMLNMKWQIFLFLLPYLDRQTDLPQELEPIFTTIFAQSEGIEDVVQRQMKQQRMLYWVADQTSRLFTNYMIYRGQCLKGCVGHCQCGQDWLTAWNQNQPIPLKKLLRQKPETQVADDELEQHYQHYQLQRAELLQTWQRFIWYHVFAQDYQDIQQVDDIFWQALSGVDGEMLRQRLPQRLYVFTLLELPPSQLLFLRRLAQYITIKVYHYTPSQEYWADSVDPKWLQKYRLDHAYAAVLYESRHPLLTRLGKQARDIGALLSGLSGGEEGEWYDVFPDDVDNMDNMGQVAKLDILHQLKSDILHLNQPIADSYALQAQDQSIQLHVCHSSYRQLEILYDQMVEWLAQDNTRQPSDILVLVPDLSAIESHIRTIFAESADSNKPTLPIKIAGVPLLDAVQLWQAICLRIQLLQQRFTIEEFIDWLNLRAIQTRYQLNFEQTERIAELLQLAGFRRGFDQQHLQLSLHESDEDYRYSFRYALDRLALSLAMPMQAVFHDVLAIDMVQRSDFALIGTLIQIYQDLATRRDWLSPQATQQQATLGESLQRLEIELVEFQEVAGLRQVQDAIQKLKRIIYRTQTQQLHLPLNYVLDEIASNIEHQLEQTEPTGQITFAQIGQLRTLPYRLVVCLNLDMGTFPKRDQRIPFDLMELLRAQLGDRSRLEDDQGAFLDALLQAQDALWIFYNGFDVEDHEAREPSSIVQELIGHLHFIVSSSDKDKIKLNGLDVYPALKTLYQIHTLQPFDQQKFNHPPQQGLAQYADEWFVVAQHITTPQSVWRWMNFSDQLSPLDHTPTDTRADDIQIDAEQWIRDLLQPARHFLAAQKIKTTAIQTVLDNYEPLQLNGLQQYILRERILTNYLHQPRLSQPNTITAEDQSLQVLLQDRLPIGKIQSATWSMAHSVVEKPLQALAYKGGAVSKTTKRQYHYRQHVFLIDVPEDSQTNTWLGIEASSCTGEKPLRIWLQYLFWQASADVKSSANLHRSVIFRDKIVTFAGVSTAQAQQYLSDWLNVWYFAQQQPFVLAPSLFCFSDLLGKNLQHIWQFIQTQHEQHGFLDIHHADYPQELKKIRNIWLNDYYHPNFPAQENNGCYLYPDWALFITEKKQAAMLFDQYTQYYAVTLYQPLTQYVHVEKIEEILAHQFLEK